MSWLLCPIGGSSRSNLSTIAKLLRSRFIHEFGTGRSSPTKNRIVDWPEDVSDIPLDLIGTSYEIQVWNLLRQIAVGETTSYGALAAKLGTRDARDVTVAISTNPIAILVPCHRVLKKNGSISGYRWGVHRKRALLEREQSALRPKK
jgi:O-6-methylguanine DNA methyltransferase